MAVNPAVVAGTLRLEQSMESLSRAAVKPMSVQPERERLLRIDEVAEWTGVSSNTLRWWRSLAQGENPQHIGPPSAKFGKRIVYRESDVQAWIDAQFAEAQ